MGVCVNVCMSKITCTPIKVGIHVYDIHELSDPDIYLTDVPFLYPLKMPENLCISGAFSGGIRTKY